MDGNVMRFPDLGDSAVKYKSVDENFDISVKEVDDSAFDIHSPDLVRLDLDNLESLAEAVPTMVQVGFLKSTIGELAHMQLYTITRDGIPVSPNELMIKKNHALMAVIADKKSKFEHVPDVNPVDMEAMPRIKALSAVGTATAIYTIIAALVQKRFLEKINKNLTQLSRDAYEIKAFLAEEQKSRLTAAISQLKEIESKKEMISESDTMKLVCLNQLANIKATSEEMRSFYGEMVQLKKDMLLEKTKQNKSENKRKQLVKDELLQNLIYYQLGHEIYAMAELELLYFDGKYSRESLDWLKKELETRNTEIKETKQLVIDAIVETELRKPGQKIGMALASIEPGIEELPLFFRCIVDTLMPRFVPSLNGHEADKAILKWLGIDVVELSRKKSKKIKDSADIKATHEVYEQRKEGLNSYVDVIDRLNGLYNKPVRILRHQDEYYLIA